MGKTLEGRVKYDGDKMWVTQGRKRINTEKTFEENDIK